MIYPITVDYSLSLEDAIKAGKYDWVNENITEEHFPSEKTNELKNTVALELLNFDEVLSSEEIEKRIQEKGYRSATLRELLAFKAEYPDEQKKYWIAALASRWQVRGGGWRFPGLGDRVLGGRALSLGNFESEFYPGWQFLVSHDSLDSGAFGTTTRKLDTWNFCPRCGLNLK